MPIRHLQNGYEAYLNDGVSEPIGVFDTVGEALSACNLCLLMREIIYDWWGEGWIKFAYYFIWESINGTSNISFRDDRLYAIAVFADKCNGWICYTNNGAEKWVPKTKWIEMYFEWKKESKDADIYS